MLNKATLIGRVRKKDIKYLKNGSQLTVISLATTRKYKDGEGVKQEITTWHNINCFSKLAEIAEKYVHVGNLVYIEGEINNKKIESGEKAGNWVYSLTASDIRLLPSSPKKEEQSNNAQTKKPTPKPSEDSSFDDSEIPF